MQSASVTGERKWGGRSRTQGGTHPWTTKGLRWQQPHTVTTESWPIVRRMPLPVPIVRRPSRTAVGVRSPRILRTEQLCAPFRCSARSGRPSESGPVLPARNPSPHATRGYSYAAFAGLAPRCRPEGRRSLLTVGGGGERIAWLRWAPPSGCRPKASSPAGGRRPRTGWAVTIGSDARSAALSRSGCRSGGRRSLAASCESGWRVGFRPPLGGRCRLVSGAER